MQLVQQLVASACHDSLTDLTLYQLSSTAAADVILQRLPNLQHVSFDNLMEAPAGSLPAHDSSWRPLADLSNMAGRLRAWSPDVGVMDLSGLSSASKLQQLDSGVLNPKTLKDINSYANLAAISSLTSLHTLQLDSVVPYEVSAAQAQANTALRGLRSLTATRSGCPATSWSALARLPAFEDVSLGSITLCAAVPAAAATSMTSQSLLLEQTAAALPGCLARQLGSFDACAADMQQVVTAAQGHRTLQELQLRGPAPAAGEPSVAWQLNSLSEMPALQSLLLDCLDQVQPASLLADIAGCSRLTQLSLSNRPGVELTAAGLEALEAGPCGDSLADITLDHFSLEAGASLMRCHMARLRTAQGEAGRVKLRLGHCSPCQGEAGRDDSARGGGGRAKGACGLAAAGRAGGAASACCSASPRL